MTDSEKLDLILFRLEKLDSLESDMQELKQRTENIDNKVINMELTLENEIRVNIKRIAEGHLDLSRGLNECIKLSNDIKDKQEVQDIYINMHNNKLKAL